MIVEFAGLMSFLLVFVRIVAMLAFNPVLTRRSVPTRVTMGLCLCLTVLITPTLSPLPELRPLEVAVAMCRELFLGFCCGYIFRMFYYLLFFVGDILDQQFGLSMAKAFDPGTNIQVSMSSKIIELLFVLYFFSTDSHIVLIRIFATSFQLIPPAAEFLTFDAVKLVLDVFIALFSLVIRLILPFAITEFILEVAMGILMKLIPQIHVFVINIQLKIFLGIALLLVLAPSVASFLDNYLVLVLENTQRLLLTLAGNS